jgi:predicted 3-demethylubiquinone-9 3-methyltransferase (glyoxalase superfamily)
MAKKQQTKRKRVEFTNRPKQEKELAWLVDRWGIGQGNTLRMLITMVSDAEKEKDRLARRGGSR